MNTPLSLKSNHDLSLIPQSIVSHDGLEFGLAYEKGGRKLVILAADEDLRLKPFEGTQSGYIGGTLL